VLPQSGCGFDPKDTSRPSRDPGEWRHASVSADMKTDGLGGDNPGDGLGCDLMPQESLRLIPSGMWGQALGGLASLLGCLGVSNLIPVVSLRSTTGYTLGCLRHSFEGRPAIQLSTRTIPKGGAGGASGRPITGQALGMTVRNGDGDRPLLARAMRHGVRSSL
jgi:hypothetical protein